MTRGSHQAKAALSGWTRGGLGSAVVAVAAGLYSIIAGAPFQQSAPRPAPSTTGSIPRVHPVPGDLIPSKTSTFVKASPSGSEAPVKTSAGPQVPAVAPSTPRPTVRPVSVVSVTKVATLIAFLHAQLGRPYVYGGNGPLSYDCSGLIVAAFKVVGIHMPRTAAQQSRVGASVPLSSLRPGDLLFWGSPATHSAVYVGGGKFIAAQNRHLGVVEVPLTYDPPGYARRVL